MLLGLAAIIFLIFVTAFFVAAEFALVSVRRTRIEQMANEGNAGAKAVRHALEHLNTYLAAAQVGITAATIGLGALGEPVLAELVVPLLESVLPHDFVLGFVNSHGIALAISIFIITVLELILGETVPKIAAIQRSVGTSMLLIRPMNLVLLIFKPFIWIINVLSNAVLRLFGLPTDAQHSTPYTVDELEMLVASSREAGVLDREEEAILRRVFDFGDLVARQVMRPRTEIVAVPLTATLAEVVHTITEHKYTRYPVYEGDLDHIVGSLHVQDVVEAQARIAGVLAAPTDKGSTVATAENGQHPDGTGPMSGADRQVLRSSGPAAQFDVRSIMRPVEAVPETLSVAALLTRMQQGRFHLVVCIDEYGGTAGIVTLEDIIEKIVGEVRGEFERPDVRSGISFTPDGVLIDGLTLLDDVNEAVGLSLQGESETIGGYVFEKLGRRVQLGDEVPADGHVLRVEELDGLRVARVRLLPRQATPTTGQAATEGGETEG
jgi:putative hemolysin